MSRISQVPATVPASAELTAFDFDICGQRLESSSAYLRDVDLMVDVTLCRNDSVRSNQNTIYITLRHQKLPDILAHKLAMKV